MKLPHWLTHDWERWIEIGTGQVTQGFYDRGVKIGEPKAVGTYFEQVRTCATCGLKQVRTIRTAL